MQARKRTNSQIHVYFSEFRPKRASANGRYVAYQSRAGNLVRRDTGGRSSIFVFDTKTLETSLVSVDAMGDPDSAVSPTTDGEPGNGDSFRPRLSSSGRFVVFESLATNLRGARAKVSVSNGQVTAVSLLRAGAGYNPDAPAPKVVIERPNGGVAATATAQVAQDGTLSAILLGSGGSGYVSGRPYKISVEPPPAAEQQIYIHDRNIDARSVYQSQNRSTSRKA